MTSAVDAGAGPMTPVELREHIQAFGLTQTELAQLLGANARTVRRWLEEDGSADGPGVPGAVATTLRAWQRLQHAALAWRPEDAPLSAAGTGPALAAQRFYALGIDAMLERVRMRGGPAVPWDVDLARQRATVGGVQLSFYVFDGGGFVPLSYRRQDALLPDPDRDPTLLEDGVACISNPRAERPTRCGLGRRRWWAAPRSCSGSSALRLP